MIRGLDYHLIDDSFPFDFKDFTNSNRYVETPLRGVYDKML
jgi:type III restriction enzyme